MKRLGMTIHSWHTGLDIVIRNSSYVGCSKELLMKGYQMAFCDGYGCEKVGMWKQFFNGDVWVMSLCPDCGGE